MTSSEERLDTLIDDVARQMTDGAPAPDFTVRVLQRVDERLPRRGWRWVWVAAPIAAAAVALIAIQVFRSAPPGTNDQTRDGVGAEVAAPVVAPAVPPEAVAQAFTPANKSILWLPPLGGRPTPAAIFRLTSLRQGYGGPPERFARRRKAEATEDCSQALRHEWCAREPSHIGRAAGAGQPLAADCAGSSPSSSASRR